MGLDLTSASINYFLNVILRGSIRDEEMQAENLQVKIQHPEVDFTREDFDVEDPNSLNFTPIDARHLSSLPLISGRVIRLLKASKNHMHASNNMLITLVR